MARRTSFLLVLALASPGVAFAATPLPDPPFSGGGFVAPSSEVLKQEEKASAALARYLKNRVQCDRSAVTSLQLAYTPVNEVKVAAVQAKWNACVGKVVQRYVDDRNRVLAKGTPSCLDESGIDAQRSAVDGLLASVRPVVFCDDGGASPDPVTGLNVPEKKQKTVGEREVATVVVKAGLDTAKCYRKAAGYAVKFGGTLDERTLAKIEACLAKITAKAASKIDFFEQTNKLPECLSTTAALGAALDAVAFAGSSTSAIYCASPGGAFVDGPATP